MVHRRASALHCLAAVSIRRLLLGACAAVLLALWAASPAGAVTATLGGSSFGFEPRDAAKPAAQGQLVYHGGPVMHSNATYAIYWDPVPSGMVTGLYDADWKALINQYLFGVAGDSGGLGNVFSVLGQYTDGTGRAAYQSTFRGAYTDTNPNPANGCSVGTVCLTDAQIRSELTRFLSANMLTGGLGTVFFVFTPPGTTVCTDSSGTDCSAAQTTPNFCSYHSFIGSASSPANTVLYAVQPWTPESACQDGSGVLEEPNQLSTADFDGDFDSALPDVLINEISIEQADTMTNPLLNGWYENSSNAEEGDECRDQFNTPPGAPQAFTGAGNAFNQTIYGGHYYLNSEFNLSAMKQDYPNGRCLLSVRLTPAFTPPTSVNVGDVVALDASESTVDLTPATYSWDFGDGSAPASGPSVFHTYTAGGVYTVTLTATDAGANSAITRQQVSVSGPPATAGTTSGSGAGGAATGSSTANGSTGAPTTAGGTSSGAGGTPSGAAAPPKASERVMTRSLAMARRKGLTVRYSVDQAVAGRFEILLDAKTAARLHINGAHSSSRASGRSVVIGSAILVTLRGGSSHLAIHFTKTAAAHLAHVRHLAVTVKMTVAGDNGQRRVVDAATLLR